MTTSLMLIAALCAIALVKIFQTFYKFYKYTVIVNKIPGPKGFPILGNALTVLRLPREDRFEWRKQLSRQYEGGIFLIWFGPIAHVTLTTAETISAIASSRKLLTKSQVYDFLYPWLGHGLLTSTDELWHQQRKLITPTFHFNILGDFSIVMSQKAEILKDVIQSKLDTNPNGSIDMFELLTRCALDIICESAMGININAQTDHQSEYSQTLHSITVQALERAFRPWLYSDWVYYRTARGKKFEHTVGISHKFTNKVISDRKLARIIQRQNSENSVEYTESDKPKRQAFLDHLLDACERENMPLTDDELREQVNTFLFAGHDTTAAAMSWALLCISNNPDVEEKIHEEQLLVFGDSEVTATLQQISELKYLDRVIKETLRLYPSAPSVGRCLTEDVQIAGYEIPKGTVVNMHLQLVQSDPKHWPNPEKFDPDRFLPENSRGRHPYAYVPFSAGPRNCIGQKFALLEEKIVLTTLLRKWRIKSPLDYQKAKCYHEIILRPQNGIDIYFTPKSKKS